MKHTKTLFHGLLLSLLLARATTSVQAETYRLPETPAEYFEAIQQTIADAQSFVDNAENLCGGWDRETHVGETPGIGSTISKVEGVPGKDGKPMGPGAENPEAVLSYLPSGMAWRNERPRTLGNGLVVDDNFHFPDSAEGKATACEPGVEEVTRWVWEQPDDDDRAAGYYTERTMRADAGEVPHFEIRDGTIYFPNEDEPLCTKPGEDGQTDPRESCAGFCGWLNGGENPDERRFTYEDCKVFCRIPDNGGFQCREWSRKYVCTEEWMNAPNRTTVTEDCWQNEPEEDTEEQTEEQPQEDPPPEEEQPPAEDFQRNLEQPVEDMWEWNGDSEMEVLPVPEEEFESPEAFTPRKRSPFVADLLEELPTEEEAGLKNCEICRGQRCRCPGPGCTELPEREEQMNPDPPPEGEAVSQGPGAWRPRKTFPSFFRKYMASTERDQVGADSGTEDILHSVPEIPVACYHAFYEEFDPKTRRTTMTDKSCVIAFPHSQETLRRTQRILGKTTQAPEEILDPAPFAPLTDEEDIWHPIPGGMSFPKEEALTERNGDLTSFFLNPERKEETAIWQRDLFELYARDSHQRATDNLVTNETRDARPLQYWIQALQMDMAKLLALPDAWMRVPRSWLAPEPNTVVAAGESGNGGGASAKTTDEPAPAPITEDTPIDVRLGIKDDISGKFLELVEEHFALQEVAIPVVIPSASIEELRAWELKTKNDDPEKSARIRDYIEQIDRYRALRGERTKTVAHLLGQQGQDTTALVQWMEQNVERYRTFLRQRRDRLALAPLVHAVQRSLTEFSDTVNLKWCRNDQRTTPIDSLNDWYPVNPSVAAVMSCRVEEGTLPLLCIPDEKDFVFDMSPFFALRRTALRVPVILPFEVAIDLTATALPDLPPVPRLDPVILAQLREVTVQSAPPLIEPPQPISLDGPRAALERAAEILNARNATYNEFWNSLEPDGPPNNPDCEAKEDRLACPRHGVCDCVHVEMDLKQRLQKATAAPGKLRLEDLELQGTHRDALATPAAPPGFDLKRAFACDPSDHLCVPVLHNVFFAQPAGWQIVGSPQAVQQEENFFEQFLVRARQETIDDEGRIRNNFPYALPAQRLYQIFDRRKDSDFDLLPQTE